MTPCLVICRDRVSYTRMCVDSLANHPDIEVHLVDHGSTWPPMLDYLHDSPHPVWRRGDHPPRDLWAWDGLAHVVGSRPYLVTDPDVVVDPACPSDWLVELRRVLHRHNHLTKVGLGLRIDDLPDTPLSARVKEWEAPFWVTKLDDHVWSAPVDTTLALHPPLHVQPGFRLVPAARLSTPYLIRHLPWYGDVHLSETAHYRERIIPGSSHWINGGW